MSYKLNGIVAFTGSHYMVFLRVPNSAIGAKVWTLFNDEEIQTFDSYLDLSRFMIEANTVPTLMIYEQSAVYI